MSPGHACEIERLHGEWQEAMCVWDMDLRCSLSIFPAQSHHFHRLAEFSFCCDAMSNRASHWGLATCAVTFGHVLRLSPVRASPGGKAALQRLSTACRDFGRLPSSLSDFLRGVSACAGAYTHDARRSTTASNALRGRCISTICFLC